MSDITVLNGKFEKSGALNTNVALDAESLSVPAVHQVVKATLLVEDKVLLKLKTRLVSEVVELNHLSKKVLVELVKVLRSPLMVVVELLDQLQESYTQKLTKK
jgi:hypothetical protein